MGARRRPTARLGQDLDDDAAPSPDPRVSTLAAGLREEVLSEATDDRTVARFLADAAGLEQRYGRMLETLGERGTRVVRHGRDSPAGLLRAFRSVGLRVLGPSLLVCAEAVARLTHDAATRAAGLVQLDARATEAELYRTLLEGDGLDALDAVSRPGPAINLQSLVTSFTCGEVKLLFAGDMQFADPQLSGQAIREELGTLRARIREEAPFRRSPAPESRRSRAGAVGRPRHLTDPSS